MATQGYVPVLAGQTTQGCSYGNIHNHNYYNIYNNYNGNPYDYRRCYHHRPQSQRYRMNNYRHTRSNHDNCDLDLTISSTYNNGIKPIYRYLESDVIKTWFMSNTNDQLDVFGKHYTHAYILRTTLSHDEWYRNDYELLLWEEYLKMGKENNFWAEEVLRYTKTCNFNTNMGFIQTQINQFKDKITELTDNINSFKAELTACWKKDHRIIPPRRLTRDLFSSDAEEPISTRKYTIGSIEQLDDCIKDYVRHYTKYAKKLTETKLQLAQAQLDEFRLF